MCFKYFDFFPRYTLICSQTHVPMFDRLIVDHLSKQKCAHKKTNEEIIYIPSYTAGGSFFVATIRTLHNLELESKWKSLYTTMTKFNLIVYFDRLLHVKLYLILYAVFTGKKKRLDGEKGNPIFKFPLFRVKEFTLKTFYYSSLASSF